MHFLKKHKIFIIVISIIIILGFTCGIGYFIFMDSNIKTETCNTIKSLEVLRYNSIFKDLIVMSLLLVSSFFFIGIPLCLFYIFYECFSWGFIFLTFISVFKIKGLIFILLYLFINKILTFTLMLLFIKKVINIERLSIGLLIYKKDNNIKEKIINTFKNAIYIIIFVLIINIILYFISPFIFSLLK